MRQIEFMFHMESCQNASKIGSFVMLSAQKNTSNKYIEINIPIEILELYNML